MSTTTTSAVAVRLNLATITQYLSAQTSLADTLAGRDRRRAVLLRSTPQWDGPAEHVWGDGQSARIAAAPSPLAVHELLLGHLSDTATGPALLVVLTDREQNELDPAILARAHKARVDTVDSWDVVRDAFGAHQVDQRLRDDKWAAEALLDAAPPRAAGTGWAAACCRGAPPCPRSRCAACDWAATRTRRPERTTPPPPTGSTPTPC